MKQFFIAHQIILSANTRLFRENRMKFQSLPEFEKDLKKLCKRYSTLTDDLEVRLKVLAEYPTGRGDDVDEIPKLNIKSKIYKSRLMCRALKGSSLRLIYSYEDCDDTIKLIEIYFKGDKPIQDNERIKSNFR